MENNKKGLFNVIDKWIDRLVTEPESAAEKSPSRLASLFMDAVEDGSGEIAYIERFPNFECTSFPAITDFYFANYWGDGMGKHTMWTRILGPDDVVLDRSGDKRIEWRMTEQLTTYRHREHYRFRFNAAGRHWAEVYLDGHLNFRFSFDVVLRAKSPENK